MSKAFKIIAAAVLVLAHQAASAIELKIDSYTSDSLTFTLSGDMPATNPGTLADGPGEIDLLYTGNLWSGGTSTTYNSLSASPFVGDGRLNVGNTGGFANIARNYSWLLFDTDLTGLAGTGKAVTLSWSGANFLNTSGTGSIDLYWGNLARGVDASGKANMLLASVSIVDGRIVGAAGPGTDVPEPASLALFAAGAAALVARRRRKA